MNPVRWAKVIDQTVCIGCHACTTACKSENEVPVSVSRTYVKSVDVGRFPATRRAFQVTRCNQCEDAPCVTACPTAAMHRRDDGIVDVDKRDCIGCKACMAACPYDAIFINPDDHSAEKCNFCAHRLEVGLEPACVTVCPVGAIMVGNLDDENSAVAQRAQRDAVQVRRPEKGTRPKLFYQGAHEATLDPLAARQPTGGLFAWAQQSTDPHQVNSGMPAGRTATSSAEALLSYDVGHAVPWDWRVSLYTWTKSVGAGVYLVAALLFLSGSLSSGGALWDWWVPMLAGGFLAATGAVLVWDLEQPRRFYYVLTRPQWRSWLVRGAVILLAFSGVLAVHVAVALFDWNGAWDGLAVVGVPLALAGAVYTAFLFGQAKGRDLWQSALLPFHLAVQAVVAGAAALAPVAALTGDPVGDDVAIVLAVAAVAHLALVAGEVSGGHPTANARMGIDEMLTGRLAGWFWAGNALVGLGVAAPWLWPIAAPAALAGLLCFEHAYVQAGQAAPLA